MSKVVPSYDYAGLARVLRTQRQVDVDGVWAGVSRQAADEAACIIEKLATPPPATPVEEAGDAELDALDERLRGFASAYPESVFGPVTEQEIADHASLITRNSVAMGRRMAKFTVEAADAINNLRVVGRLSERVIAELRATVRQQAAEIERLRDVGLAEVDLRYDEVERRRGQVDRYEARIATLESTLAACCQAGTDVIYRAGFLAGIEHAAKHFDGRLFLGSTDGGNAAAARIRELASKEAAGRDAT